MKILYFFLFLWVIFALLDPDPATQINADPDLDTDPDPQPCLSQIKITVKVGMNLHTRWSEYIGFYSLKNWRILVPNIWWIFHVPTQIYCLTGTIIARHI
jgi:hypothetical protein